ncbi:hypothetical protein [Ensifer sp. LCM 4579]|uniref:hypothetical protein n=1 Tax=Ensifer sp. LCM 4579 TaxID=1848292 RepID=UPI00155EC0D3|nr:hypothetical protein [Ensifer sp. LCM 4579]
MPKVFAAIPMRIMRHPRESLLSAIRVRHGGCAAHPLKLRVYVALHIFGPGEVIF